MRAKLREVWGRVDARMRPWWWVFAGLLLVAGVW